MQGGQSPPAERYGTSDNDVVFIYIVENSEYTFQVTAVDRDLNYSMPATVEIAVVPDSRDEKIDELEVRVRERTRELSGKNAELENTLAELREMQDQLIVQEKMASLGNLVAGLAHELNSPVGAIKSTADVSGRGLAKIGGLLEAVSRGEGSVERVQPILQLLQRNEEATTDAVGRLSRIVESLKTYTFAAWATILSGRRMPTIVPRSWLSGFVSRGSRSAHQKSLLSPASPMCWLSSLIARSRFRASQTRTDWKTTWWRLSQHGREEGERR